MNCGSEESIHQHCKPLSSHLFPLRKQGSYYVTGWLLYNDKSVVPVGYACLEMNASCNRIPAPPLCSPASG